MGPKKKIKQVKLDEWDVRVAVENEGEEELSFSKKEKKKRLWQPNIHHHHY